METKLKNNTKDLGTLKANSKNKTFFEFKEKVEVQSLHSSCGCSRPIYNKELNRIEVSYTPGSVPKHLAQKGYYTTSKFITINYVGGSSEKAKLTAKIIK